MFNYENFFNTVLGNEPLPPDANKRAMRDLIVLLEAAEIPYESHINPFTGREQVVYFGHKGKPEIPEGSIAGPGYGAVCSVIYGYGAENDLLEICGLIKETDNATSNVVGNLTAEDIFDRIKADWNA